jgi:hypothetical protein
MSQAKSSQSRVIDGIGGATVIVLRPSGDFGSDACGTTVVSNPMPGSGHGKVVKLAVRCSENRYNIDPAVEPQKYNRSTRKRIGILTFLEAAFMSLF